MGGVSWQFKKFADASSKLWYTQGWKDKLFAGFTNSAAMNGDKVTTLTYLFTLAMQHGGIWVSTGHAAEQQQGRHARLDELRGRLRRPADAIAVRMRARPKC